MKQFIVAFLVLCLTNVASAGVRTFAWDQNTESDLKGYKAYRSVSPDVEKIPTNLWLTIWKPGENPELPNTSYVEYTINAEGDCQISHNLLPNGIYYLVWTAFDEADNESGLSNELYVNIYDGVELGQWEFNCTPITGIPDLAGYRLYIVPNGYPVRIGHGQQYWQGDTSVVFPKVLDIPVGNWDSVMTSFDTDDNESAPTPICNVLLGDTPPPMPANYSCQGT